MKIAGAFLSVILAWALLGNCASGSVAATAIEGTEPAYYEPIIYISANGNNDNDGLSESKPIQSLVLALYKAREQSIKTITVIGTLDLKSELPSRLDVANITARPLPADEFGRAPMAVTITGKPGAVDAERAVLSAKGSRARVIRVISGVTVRYEHIEISGGEGESGFGIYIDDGAYVSLGPGAVVQGNESFGIYINNGTCVIDGGEVRDNTRTGIRVSSKGVLTMLDGAISDNRSAANGGGVLVESGGRFTMSGGTIAGNSANMAGGGVFVMSGSMFDQTGGTVSGNTAGRGSNPDVYRESGSAGSNL